ncbi:hypothetical protein [Mycobacterium sp.]|uniref:hypothetical protein n=1 Tax=Mycobacterium sp. TaxID=1785 RepID=UPI002C8825BB|nr:hypothetical protein [Mycobacterium sp.]HTQ17881.1 hypothetical protein [Mycobacterium sp.]
MTVKAGPPAPRKSSTLDVRVDGDKAYTNSFWEGWGNILIGVGALALGVFTLLPSRRSLSPPSGA